MNPNVNVSSGRTTKSYRGLVRRTPILQYVLLIVVAIISTSCADDVVMKNPRTGTTETCQQSLHGLDPWSQTMACVANHEAQGWTRIDQE